VANWICDVLDSRGDEQVISDTRDKVKAICAKKPVYEKNQ